MNFPSSIQQDLGCRCVAVERPPGFCRTPETPAAPKKTPRRKQSDWQMQERVKELEAKNLGDVTGWAEHIVWLDKSWLIFVGDFVPRKGGFHQWGYPHSWMVFVREIPIKWMMIGGYPYDLGPPLLFILDDPQ